MPARFNPPPNWPAPPEGWVPQAGWQPDPAWGPAPPGWVFWVEGDAPSAPTSGETQPPQANVVVPEASRSAPSHKKEGHLFGSRARAAELTEQVTWLTNELAEARAGLVEARTELTRLGAMEVADLQRESAKLTQQIADLQADQQRAEQEHAARLARQAADAQAALTSQEEALRGQIAAEQAELTALQTSAVATKEIVLLQEAGVYEYRHPLDDAVAYQAELAKLRDAIRAMTLRDGGAVQGATNWTVNGSLPQGRKMVRDFSKLMLRAYNAEADNLVRGLKPYKLTSSVDRLAKVAVTIVKLGSTMNIRISDAYHLLRVKELELTADYIERVARDKEREREEKARLREEQQAQMELQRERARLEKERQHHANVLAALHAKGDLEAAARIQAALDELDGAIAQVDYRVANVRAGFVYVISNVGAFGERMVKVGMTRRLEPQERVRELGDASVPFRFDTHALFFSTDAYGIESAMHARLADRRVNRVNNRREFFYCTPLEAKAHLLELTGELVEFTEHPEALEYRQSVNAAEAGTTS